MRTTNQEQNIGTRVSDIISAALQKKEMSIKDLAVKLSITYEHARRIVKGEGAPGQHLLRLICEALDIDFEDTQRIATTDKVEKKYGGILAQISGKTPGLEPIERVWETLTPSQQRDAITMIRGWAKSNRA